MKIIPRKRYYIVKTDKGTFYLKRIDYNTSQILFIHNVKEYLVYRGFKNIDRYIMAGKIPYVEHDKDIYTMTKWIKGRKYDINNSSELKKLAIALARFHNASKGYIPMKGIKCISNIGRLQEDYLEKCQDYIYIKSLVKMRTIKSKIDDLYLNNVNKLYDMGIEAVKMLQKNGYFELCNNAIKEKSLCHNNYNSNNIIIDKNGEVNILNFDNCKFELRCYDIANFIIDVMERLNWDFDKALNILKAYDYVGNLEEIEYKLMASFLQFPKDIWNIATKYYYEEYDFHKDKYYNKLKSKIEKLPYKVEFLNKYKNEFL
ncbi:CotS family spore coat protein [Paramaledivibacter caminithermalis]|uniref:Spore coat protein, CotS family n=1 Tax=Paramaledivibacter caminithermalis (strain DSM 15212 / CIP 107654 / DViRD3) TaxID=1121301 RepID=A0A1M6KHV5_PARC5|nr:CotS family spore coat protein [Paramaledivibacter caminithermalis]SHJ58519.1 spore coat protein, CotS family [Paramaledivibacter caminithermalis DSM 15212]